jgi:hypothetical protein
MPQRYGNGYRRLFYNLYRKKAPKNEAQAWGNLRNLQGKWRA